MKRLPSITIVPSDLYVERSADRQLRRLVQEMGRPGYVLVARQMGKTNLLLNAKRELQRPEDVFVYADLSRPFDSAQACFRNIIDTALETHQILAPAIDGIRAIRGHDHPSYKEHEQELRHLLSVASGKLVVILDEIDALTTTDFSDQVFSQIRSVYFSRANIPEFSRLTYILSGVAEPSELIQNTKLSPFNIGEKIYLDDFSLAEYSEFLRRAELEFSDEVRARIFYWTNGNPRMTWDVCAELADRDPTQGLLSTQDVDASVRQLYLASFDRAPVDHIRTLATSSSEIRRALVEIRYGKGTTLSDATRSKLYLAGIIGSGPSVGVRNRIVDLTLSEQWLEGVERGRSDLLVQGTEELLHGSPRAAMATLQRYLSEGDPSEQDRRAAYFSLARAAASIGDFQKALEWHEQAPYDKRFDAAQHFEQVFHQGLCYYRLGRFQEARARYEAVLAWGGRADLTVQALCNIGSCWLSEVHPDALDHFYASSDRALALLQTDTSLSGRDRQTLNVAVRYNLARALAGQGKKAEAASYLEEAMPSASSSERAVLLYEQALVTTDLSVRRTLVNQAVSLVVAESSSGSRTGSLLEVGGREKANLLELAFQVDEAGAFAKLLKHLFDPAKEDEESSVAAVEWLTKRLASSDPLANRSLMARFVEATSSHRGLEFQRARLLAHQSRGSKDSITHAARYMSLLREEPPRPLDEVDHAILAQAVAEAVRGGMYSRANDTLRLVEAFRSASPIEYFIVFDYWAMVMATKREDGAGAFRLAQRLLSQIPKTKTPLAPAFRTIQDQALRVVSGDQIGQRASQKVPRNDRVRVKFVDGRVVVDKYKRVEDDLRRGRCILLEVVESK